MAENKDWCFKTQKKETSYQKVPWANYIEICTEPVTSKIICYMTCQQSWSFVMCIIFTVASIYDRNKNIDTSLLLLFQRSSPAFQYDMFWLTTWCSWSQSSLYWNQYRVCGPQVEKWWQAQTTVLHSKLGWVSSYQLFFRVPSGHWTLFFSVYWTLTPCVPCYQETSSS